MKTLHFCVVVCIHENQSLGVFIHEIHHFSNLDLFLESLYLSNRNAFIYLNRNSDSAIRCFQRHRESYADHSIVGQQ